MSHDRRSFVRLMTASLAVPWVATPAAAKNYPSKAVRIVVGYAVGGSNDIYARLIGQWLSDRLKHAFVVENRPGAGSNIATESVAKSAPDGYTILLVNPANAINASLYDGLSFDFLRDIAPVASMVRQPLVMLVHPSVPAKTIPDFIAWAKAAPGRAAMASAGPGSINHLAGELFKMNAAIDMVHVPYRGAGPAMNDLLSGQVQVFFGGIASASGHVKQGTLRALGVTSSVRSEAFPDIPCISDHLDGYEAGDWFGLGVPSGTPDEIIQQLNAEVNAALLDGKLKARIADIGGILAPGSPSDFGQTIVGETRKWASVIKSAAIKPE